MQQLQMWIIECNDASAVYLKQWFFTVRCCCLILEHEILRQSDNTQRQRAEDIISVLELYLKWQNQNHRLLAGKAEWKINNPDQKWRAFIKRVGMHNNTVATVSPTEVRLHLGAFRKFWSAVIVVNFGKSSESSVSFSFVSFRFDYSLIYQLCS